MIESLFLRWVVTILFALAAAQCLYALVALRMPWTSKVGHVLHLVMSVAMLVMAWPFSMSWPTTGPMVFFVLATVWFLVTVALPMTSSPDDDCGCVPTSDTASGRGVAVYHAAMMAAMAWMYAAMNGTILPGSSSDGGSHQMAGHTMPADGAVHAHEHGHGHDMGGMHAAQPGYVQPVNWILGVAFIVATAVWLYVFFDRRRRDGARADLLSHSGDLCQVLMAAGMGLMFLSIA